MLDPFVLTMWPAVPNSTPFTPRYVLRGDAPCGDAVDAVAGLPMSADGGTFLGTELYVHSMQNDRPKHTVIICSMFLFSDSFPVRHRPLTSTKIDNLSLQLKDSRPAGICT